MSARITTASIEAYLSGAAKICTSPSGGDGPLLTPAEGLIASIVASRPGISGAEIVKASKGSIPSGTIYTTLGRMEDIGAIERISARYCRLTTLGERLLRAQELISLIKRIAYEGAP